MVSRMLDKKIWNALCQFQTHDLVRRRYLQKHEVEADPQKAREISACFIQGQEYFASATAADETVRPLLLYYGIQSLSKGMILFLNHSADELSLQSGHGLSTSKWKDRLGCGAGILDLDVKVQPGTFLEFVTAIAGYETGAIPVHDGGIQIMPFADTCSIAKGQNFSLNDVLARMPKLWHTYWSVTGDRPASRPGMILHQQNAFVVRVMADPVAGVQTEDEVRKLFHVPAEILIGLWPADDLYGVNYFGYRVEQDSGGSYPTACPLCEGNGGSFGSLVSPWPNKAYVSPATKLFIVAYFLGMLVRYYPSRWMALIRGQEGDAVLPLLREAIDQVENEFPELALSILGWV